MVGSPVAALEKLTGFYRREESDLPLQLIVREGALTILTGDALGMLVPLGADRFQLVGSSTVGMSTWPAEGSAAWHLTGPVGGRDKSLDGGHRPTSSLDSSAATIAEN